MSDSRNLVWSEKCVGEGCHTVYLPCWYKLCERLLMSGRCFLARSKNNTFTLSNQVVYFLAQTKSMKKCKTWGRYVYQKKHFYMIHSISLVMVMLLFLLVFAISLRAVCAKMNNKNVTEQDELRCYRTVKKILLKFPSAMLNRAGLGHPNKDPPQCIKPKTNILRTGLSPIRK